MNENKSKPTRPCEVTIYRMKELEKEVHQLRQRTRIIFWVLIAIGAEVFPLSLETVLNIISG